MPHPCTWLVEFFAHTPDGPVSETRECGAPAVETYDGRGFRCEAGHEHVPIEIDLAPFGPAWEREKEERR